MVSDSLELKERIGSGMDLVMSNWFHRLLNPHCPDCAAERLENKVCSNCDVLKSLLEQERFNNKQLLESILDINKPVREVVIPSNAAEFKPKANYWKVKQAELEAQDRKAAQLMRERQAEIQPVKAKEIDELEKELDIINEQKENENAS